MKIALLGGNGRTGREFLDRALNVGHVVTALVRSEDRLSDVRHEGLTVRVGSPCSAEVLESLLPGHDVVVSVLGPRWPSKAAAAIYPASAKAIVEAAQRSRVRRLVVTSSALLFPDNTWMGNVLKRLVQPIVKGAGQMEARIRASNLDWTIVRTSFLTNGASTNYQVAVDALPKGGGAVSRAAVATFLMKEMEPPNHVQQVLGFCG